MYNFFHDMEFETKLELKILQFYINMIVYWKSPDKPAFLTTFNLNNFTIESGVKSLLFI